MPRPLRMLYVAGPGDVATTYAHWKAGRDDPSQVAMTYSGQFYDVCKQLGAEALIISSSRNPGDVRDGPFRIIHRPILFSRRRGPLYHLGQIWSGFRLTVSAARFGADVAVISNGVHWLSLRAFPLMGIKVIPTLHCVFWPLAKPPSGLGGFVQRLNARFLRRHASAFLCASSDVAEQLERLTGRTDVTVFMPTYRRETFDDPPPAPPATPPFRVMYAGRVERNKGVFALLDIAKRFAADGRPEIEFDLCGR
ncbi:MAG: glycosyltransferase, partial [Tepidisphaeraceae bacterium]